MILPIHSLMTPLERPHPSRKHCERWWFSVVRKSGQGSENKNYEYEYFSYYLHNVYVVEVSSFIVKRQVLDKWLALFHDRSHSFELHGFLSLSLGISLSRFLSFYKTSWYNFVTLTWNRIVLLDVSYNVLSH